MTSGSNSCRVIYKHFKSAPVLSDFFKTFVCKFEFVCESLDLDSIQNPQNCQGYLKACCHKLMFSYILFSRIQIPIHYDEPCDGKYTVYTVVIITLQCYIIIEYR